MPKATMTRCNKWQNIYNYRFSINNKINKIRKRNSRKPTRKEENKDYNGWVAHVCMNEWIKSYPIPKGTTDFAKNKVGSRIDPPLWAYGWPLETFK